MPFAEEGQLLSPSVLQAEDSLPRSARSSPRSRTPASSDEGSVGSNEVSEVMSPQVSQETMGPATVTDLPRYHSLVEDFGQLANRWMAAGQLRGPANVGGGYLLDLRIPLSGEEGDVLLGEIVRDNEGEMDL